jgi:tripeptidyl-peptidase I
VRTTEYSLPAHLDQHVELVQPTTVFLRTRGHRSTLRFSPSAQVSPSSADAKIVIPGSAQSVNASCNSTITVSCLKQLYNIVDYVPRATHQNAIAVTGYLGEFANFADLRQFHADQVPGAANTSFNVVFINGVLLPFVSLFREDDFSNQFDATYNAKAARTIRVVLGARPIWMYNSL